MSSTCIYEKDIICQNCFDEREKNASNTYCDNFLDSNIPLNFIPGFFFIKLAKTIKYSDGCVHHVYIHGRHEKWSGHNNDEYNMKKCKLCFNFNQHFYKLESYE